MSVHQGPCGWRTALITLVVLIAAGSISHLAAQSTASISGSVANEAGAPIEGARIAIDPGGIGAITDVRGAFRVAGVPSGTVRVTATRIGYRIAEEVVTVAPGSDQRITLVLRQNALEIGGIVVSVSREAQRLAATPASVGVVAGREMRETGIAHPGDVMRQIPGAWVSVTAGEGHQTAIRQPLTTSPVYLFLEDGIPTRSTGFFNHNALYEVNLPQAERIEVTKGPATALYGSDAIGGIVNVATRAPATAPEVGVSLEGGSFGWQRLLASASGPIGDNGVRADLNLTRTDGWRNATGYDRQSGTLRWDRPVGSGSIRTVLTFSSIDQSSAGSSALREDDYLADRTLNYTPISYRKVKAVRLSSEYSLSRENTLLTFIPFARWNEMELLANWTLSYDPTVYTTGHRSLGMLAKVRHDFEPLASRIIAGVDIEYSPGFRLEDTIQTTREGRVFTGYKPLYSLYDYDVTYRAASPYVQAEASPLPRVRLVGGLRLDMMEFGYVSRLDPIQTGRHRRPEDTTIGYRHISPKLGATYEPADGVSLFVNYGHGFRAPSEGQLFRQGQAANTVDLDPVKVDSYEAGLRGSLAGRVDYQVSAYHMTKTDDIVNLGVQDGSTVTVNAGETLHRGLEVGLGAEIFTGLRADVAYSRAKHTYEDFDADLAGNEIETAPRTLANASVSYRPGLFDGSVVGLEWTRVGSYWMDPRNTHKYAGHSLLGIRATVPLPGGLNLYGRVANLTDARYAENAAFTAARGREYAPGMPRTIYLGLQRN